MASVKFNLRKPKSEKETPVNLVIRYNNIKVVYPTGEKINPKFWNKQAGQAKQSRQFPEHPEFNTRLDHIRSTAKTVIWNYQNNNNHRLPTPHELKKYLDKAFHRGKEITPKTLFEFIEYYIEKSEGRINPANGKKITPATIQKYQATLSHLKAFQRKSKRPIDFNSIDLDFYEEFKQYLTNDVGLAINTIGKTINILKTFLNAARDLGINNYTTYQSNRFRSISEETESIYLNEKELSAIYNLDLSDSPRLEKVRDLFLIGAWTGLRFSDFSRITPENMQGDYIKIESQKTGEKVSIPFHPIVREILNKYQNQLPEPISNQKMNTYLKEICSKVDALHEGTSRAITKGGMRKTVNYKKYELITTHTARRSFATNLYLQGFPALSIMAITGHRTEQAFLKYIKISKQQHARKLADHWQSETNMKVS